jgi:hypothetical protein
VRSADSNRIRSSLTSLKIMGEIKMTEEEIKQEVSVKFKEVK